MILRGSNCVFKLDFRAAGVTQKFSRAVLQTSDSWNNGRAGNNPFPASAQPTPTYANSHPALIPVVRQARNARSTGKAKT